MSHKLRYPLHALFTSLIVLASAFGVPSCDNTTYNGPGWYDGTWHCSAPNYSHKDEFDGWDPCCERSVCCPNPLLDHNSPVDGAAPPLTVWDPCCKVGACPGHNPWLPKDASAPSPGMPDGGADADASACNDTCDGDCVPRAAPPFSGPLLVAFTALGEEPGCPFGSKPVLTNHFKDLSISPLNCSACACDPPTGECGLPGTMTAHSASCPGDAQGSVNSDFSPPPGWDGSCTAKGAIAGGAQCNGKPCVRSLSVAPLTLEEHGCAPHTTGPTRPPDAPAWKTAATICQPSTCEGGNGACVTKAGSPRFDWALCLATSGENAVCPAPYLERHVVYEGFKDGRTCSACSCDPPSGSGCISSLSVYTGSTCQGPAAIGGLNVTADEVPFCVDLPPGISLGSKVMTRSAYVPGSCEPRGGTSTGEVALSGAVSLCCRHG